MVRSRVVNEPAAFTAAPTASDGRPSDKALSYECRSHSADYVPNHGSLYQLRAEARHPFPVPHVRAAPGVPESAGSRVLISSGFSTVQPAKSIEFPSRIEVKLLSFLSQLVKAVRKEKTLDG